MMQADGGMVCSFFLADSLHRRQPLRDDLPVQTQTLTALQVVGGWMQQKLMGSGLCV
jgi:hypothetical protein